METVRNLLIQRQIPGSASFHSAELWRRCLEELGRGETVDDPTAWASACEYLARSMLDATVAAEDIAMSWQISAARLLAVLPELREASKFRSYVGEWIRLGKPELEETTDVATWTPDVDEDVQPDQTDLWEVVDPPSEASPVDDESQGDAPGPVAPETSGVTEDTFPSRFKARFGRYEWQRDAGARWRESDRRGIFEVVTGAGKTFFAMYELACLLDEVAAEGRELQVVIVVPTLVLVDQWFDNIRTSLDTKGLRVGRICTGHQCFPPAQDILITTIRSACRILEDLKPTRPLLLIADECHRLGAPAAMRVLDTHYTYTMGLSATPERAGDTAFEDVLVPKLGPVVFKYGYRDAVADGIISEFEILRVPLELSLDERAAYEVASDKVTKLLDALRASYPDLKRAYGRRFWQILGNLKREHGQEDERFAMFTAVTQERRAIVHLAASKFGAIAELARAVPARRRVLCFHERIEAADRILRVVENAGGRVAAYHSGFPQEQRAQNLASFRDQHAEWLVACRSLDEGLDIPSVDTVLIAAGTKSTRQTIQRLGRALRKKGPAQRAHVVVLEVVGVSDDVFDDETLEDLRSAALDVRICTVAEVVRTLSVVPGSESVSATPPQSTIAKLFQRAKQLLAPASNPATSMAQRRPDWSRSRPQSWTGTSGTIGYYDKDRSPD